jgi:hypothetical protein
LSCSTPFTWHVVLLFLLKLFTPFIRHAAPLLLLDLLLFLVDVLFYSSCSTRCAPFVRSIAPFAQHVVPLLLLDLFCSFCSTYCFAPFA